MPFENKTDAAITIVDQMYKIQHLEYEIERLKDTRLHLQTEHIKELNSKNLILKGVIKDQKEVIELLRLSNSLKSEKIEQYKKEIK